MALTDDDKQWITTQLQRLDVKVERLDAKVGGLEKSLQSEIKEYIDERTHDAETRLLRAFADYNTNTGIRFRKLEADASNLDTSSTIRLGELERQMSELQAKVILLESRT